MTRVLKECFGSVISSLAKMRECARCELLQECRAMNWTEPDGGEPAPRSGDLPPGRDAGGSDPSGESPPIG